MPTQGGEDVKGDWEVNLVTTALSYRNRGIATRLVVELENWVMCRVVGRKVRVLVRTVDEISGAYWREKQGFTRVDEYCIVLPKGFSHIKDAKEDMRMQREVFLWTGEKFIGEGT